MPILTSSSGGVTQIVLDNGPLNLLTPELHRDLCRALRAFEADDSARVAVLRGAGVRAFSAGDDIKRERAPLTPPQEVRRTLGARRDDSVEDDQPGWDRDVLELRRNKPVVAAINGWCLGQGFIYACRLADIRIASRHAQFGLPEISYGMAGAAAMSGILQMLPRAIAMQLSLTGEPLDAEEARRCFLVNEVTDGDDAGPRALALAERIASHPPLALRAEMETLALSDLQDNARSYRLIRAIDRFQRLSNGSDAVPDKFRPDA
ncbi:enoyl-CoA hydratase/isomerase family protein [Pararhodobacter aggregans]|uniref:enoyl-CoA hydratase/isomerase family protein n=1 Tax=Pararhodobacter aggregans TaxID=404875 RepID=UPI003A8DC4B4